MKLEPVNKLNTNTTTSKETDDDVVLANYDVVVIFSDFWPIWNNPEAKNPNPQSLFFKFSLITTFYATKTENRTKISLTQPSYYCQGIS